MRILLVGLGLVLLAYGPAEAQMKADEYMTLNRVERSAVVAGFVAGYATALSMGDLVLEKYRSFTERAAPGSLYNGPRLPLSELVKCYRPEGLSPLEVGAAIETELRGMPRAKWATTEVSDLMLGAFKRLQCGATERK